MKWIHPQLCSMNFNSKTYMFIQLIESKLAKYSNARHIICPSLIYAQGDLGFFVVGRKNLLVV